MKRSAPESREEDRQKLESIPSSTGGKGPSIPKGNHAVQKSQLFCGDNTGCTATVANHLPVLCSEPTIMSPGAAGFDGKWSVWEGDRLEKAKPYSSCWRYGEGLAMIRLMKSTEVETAREEHHISDPREKRILAQKIFPRGEVSHQIAPSLNG